METGSWDASQDVTEKELLQRIHQLMSIIRSLDLQTQNLLGMSVDISQQSEEDIVENTNFGKVFKEDLTKTWEDLQHYLISYKCKVLFTTFGNLASDIIQDFHPNVLIGDEIANTQLSKVIMAAGQCAATLERVVLLRDPQQLPPYAEPSKRNPLKKQQEVNAISSLMETGVPAVHLNLQFRMRPSNSILLNQVVLPRSRHSHLKLTPCHTPKSSQSHRCSSW